MHSEINICWYLSSAVMLLKLLWMWWVDKLGTISCTRRPCVLFPICLNLWFITQSSHLFPQIIWITLNSFVRNKRVLRISVNLRGKVSFLIIGRNRSGNDLDYGIFPDNPSQLLIHSNQNLNKVLGKIPYPRSVPDWSRPMAEITENLCSKRWLSEISVICREM